MFLHREGLGYFRAELEKAREQIGKGEHSRELQEFVGRTLKDFSTYADDIDAHLKEEEGSLLRRMHSEMVEEFLVRMLKRDGTLEHTLNGLLGEIRGVESAYEQLIAEIRLVQGVFPASQQQFQELKSKLPQVTRLIDTVDAVDRASRNLATQLGRADDLLRKEAEYVNLLEKHFKDTISTTDHFRRNIASWLR